MALECDFVHKEWTFEVAIVFFTYTGRHIYFVIVFIWLLDSWFKYRSTVRTENDDESEVQINNCKYAK